MFKNTFTDLGMASLQLKHSPWEMMLWNTHLESLLEHNFIIIKIIYNKKVNQVWLSGIYSMSNYGDYSCMIYNNHRKNNPSSEHYINWICCTVQVFSPSLRVFNLDCQRHINTTGKVFQCLFSVKRLSNHWITKLFFSSLNVKIQLPCLEFWV